MRLIPMPDDADGERGGRPADQVQKERVRSAKFALTANEDGTLSHRSNFALLNLLTKNKSDTWWIGPDRVPA